MPNIRRNYATLTQIEKNNFRNAILSLKNKPPISGSLSSSNNLYNDLAKYHSSNAVHIQSSFSNTSDAEAWKYWLLWHRLYILIFENELRDAGFPFLPYWNWNPIISPSSNKVVDTVPSEFKAIGSPLSETKYKVGILQKTTRRDYIPPYSGSPQVSNITLSGGGVNDIGIKICKAMNNSVYAKSTNSSNPIYGGFSGDFATPHDDIHGAVIGGSFNSHGAAAYDPLFWVDHANVDRIFTAWLSNVSHKNSLNTFISSNTYGNTVIDQITFGSLFPNNVLKSNWDYSGIKIKNLFSGQPIKIKNKKSDKMRDITYGYDCLEMVICSHQNGTQLKTNIANIDNGSSMLLFSPFKGSFDAVVYMIGFEKFNESANINILAGSRRALIGTLSYFTGDHSGMVIGGMSGMHKPKPSSVVYRYICVSSDFVSQNDLKQLTFEARRSDGSLMPSSVFEGSQAMIEFTIYDGL